MGAKCDEHAGYAEMQRSSFGFKMKPVFSTKRMHAASEAGKILVNLCCDWTYVYIIVWEKMS